MMKRERKAREMVKRGRKQREIRMRTKKTVKRRKENDYAKW